MFLRLPLATEYCFESDCHGHDQFVKQKKNLEPLSTYLTEGTGTQKVFAKFAS